MDEKLRKFQLESQVKNSTPGQRLIMLDDGLGSAWFRADRLANKFEAVPA